MTTSTLFFRAALQCALSAAVAFSSCALAQSAADSFPSKPVTIVLAVASGGPTDVEARLYQKKMTELLGQPFLLDYKVGAGGVIGAAYVAKAPADGHTLLILQGNFTVMPAVYKNLTFDTLKDFAPISLMSEKPQTLIVSSSFPARTFPEYVAYAKANPGKINLGITGQGGVNHLMDVWLHTLANIRVTYVAYKGEGPLLPDILSGRLDAAAISMGTALRLAKAGKVRALGTSVSVRSRVWPDLPSIAEQGVPQFNYTSWVGIGAPGGTPVPIINKLNENFAKTAKSPEVVNALEPEGWVMVGSTPAQFRQMIITETERWKKLVQDNGITVAD